MLTLTPSKSFEIVHIDTFQIKQSLTIVDDFSKYGHAYPLISANGEGVVEKIIHWVSHFSIRPSSTTDNGLELKKHQML